jgi:hypothetical protein
MSWDSVSLSNVFLATIALTNIVVIALLYEHFYRRSK